MKHISAHSALVFLGLLPWSSQVSAKAVRQDAELFASDLGANDDGSSGPVALGFTAYFAGKDETEVYVSNNGYVAFGQAGGEQFTSTLFTQKLLAPFFADVDTRGAASSTAHWGTGMVDGHRAFAATWPGVGYFMVHSDRLNTFQVVIIDRSDLSPGDVDVEMNYDSITWDCGDSECHGGGQGTHSAWVGFSDGMTDTALEGSGVPGAFLNDNLQTGLANGHQGGETAGRYLYPFRRAYPDSGVSDQPLPLNDKKQDPAALFGCATGSTVHPSSRTPWAAALFMLAVVWVVRREVS